jgi:hypothetical protein
LVLESLKVDDDLDTVDVGFRVLIDIPADNAKSVCARRSAVPQKCGYEKVLGGGSGWSDGGKMMVLRRLEDGVDVETLRQTIMTKCSRA